MNFDAIPANGGSLDEVPKKIREFQNLFWKSGEFFEGPNLVKRLDGRSPRVVINLVKRPTDWTQDGKGAGARKREATFQKRIASNRFGALRGCGLNMPKLSVKHQSSKISNKLEFSTLPRNLAKLLLYAVPSFRQGWSCGLEWMKFILFLSVGKSGKGKSSFAILGFALGGADCKCAFSCAVANCFLFIVAPAKSNFSIAKILNAVSDFIVAVDNIINAIDKI